MLNLSITSKTANAITWFLLLLSVIVTVGLVSVVGSGSTGTLMEYVDVIGAISSTFGFWIAFFQLLAIKRASEVARMTAVKTKKKIRGGMAMVKCADAIAEIRLIERCLSEKHFREAKISINNLETIVVYFIDFPSLYPGIVTKKDVEFLSDIESGLESFDTELYDVLSDQKGKSDLQGHEFVFKIQKLKSRILSFQDRLQNKVFSDDDEDKNDD